jgi:NAD(P)-dependent dehydrogenase (short-subunit alcohol dehydrogenase family)
MVVIAITGGAGTVGLETARQLSTIPEVTKIVITARSSKRADEAISKLTKATGKEQSFYESVVLDLADPSSIDAAIPSFPAFDRICLNAGGLAKGMHPSGVGIPNGMIINTVGHALLIDKLIAAGKCPAGTRIVYVSTEITRNMWSLVPLAPNYCGYFKEKDIEWAITKEYDGICSCFPLRKQLGTYKNAKIIGSMHFAHLAKEKPELHVMTVSPGATGGAFGEVAFFPMKQILGCCGVSLFRCMCVAQGCKTKTAVEIGAKRYVDVLTGEPAWKTGSMPMSGYPCPCCCCMWSACGPMTDNRPLVAYFQDEELHEKTANQVRAHAKKWASMPPGQMAMT